MTIEEIIQGLYRGDSRAIKEAIKALEKELCEDCVSRKKLEKLKKWRLSYDNNTTIPKSDIFVKLTDIRALPPVTPKGVTVTDFADKCRECGKQRKGKWIAKENIHGLERYYECSNCGNHCLYEYVEIGFQNAKTNYCPNCGAKMGVQE
jgi:hypothetical protein